MAVFSKVAMTTLGLNLYAKVQAGAALNFTRMQIGGGQLPVGNDPAAQTALITPIAYFAINSYSTNLNTASIKGIFENTLITVDTYTCELGLFASDPDLGEILYAYANALTQGDTIPPISSGPLSKQFQINVAIGNTVNVTATIPADTYIPVSQKGTANGTASLGGDGKVPSTQLPTASSAATPNATMQRDANSRAQVADPAAAQDIATKQYADTKAPLASPAFTDIPTAPTAAAATNTTQLATTAFVQLLINNLINGSPGALDTLKELADAMGDDPNFAATVTNALAGKVDLTTAQTITGAKTFFSKVTTSAGSLGTVAGNTLEIKDDAGITGNSVHLITRLRRTANGTDFTTVAIDLLRRIDGVDMQYLSFGSDGGIKTPNNTLDDGAGNSVFTNSMTFSAAAGRNLLAGLEFIIKRDTQDFRITDSTNANTLLSLTEAGNAAIAGSLTVGAGGSFANSKAANGYQKLPGGLIIQWARITVPGNGTPSGVNWVFPTAFPTACVNVNATLINTSGTSIVQVNSVIQTQAQIIQNTDTSARDAYVFAIGY